MADLWADAAAGKITPIAEGAAKQKPQEDEEQIAVDGENAAGLLAASGKYAAGTEKIYIDIGAILDLRLGTIAHIDEKAAAGVLRTGKYFKRQTDTFEGVSAAAYKAAYKAKPKEALQRSVVTNVSFFIKRMIKDAMLFTIQNRVHEPMVFEVNIHPYKFSDEEIRMLIMCLRFVTYSTSAIRIVSLSNEELTPEFCSSNYEIMIRYDWLEWMEMHKKFYETKRTPNLVMVVPEIFPEQAPTEEDVQTLELDKHNPFRETERMFAPLFRLKMYPVSLFCMTEQITKDNANKIIDHIGLTEEDIMSYIEQYEKPKAVKNENPLKEVPVNLSMDSQEYDLL